MFLAVTDGPPAADRWAYGVGLALGARLAKQAADATPATPDAPDDGPVPAYNLAGTLYLASTGWLLLGVPNALVYGIYAAMREPGASLPPGPGPGGRLNAHVTVMRPEELARVGGPDRVTERGKQFHYSLGRLVTVEPASWQGVDRVWMVTVHSPELQALRRSYGLSSLPNGGRHAFHVTVAVRRRGVLARNDKSKADSAAPAVAAA
jgi:hypothetical protein